MQPLTRALRGRTHVRVYAGLYTFTNNLSQEKGEKVGDISWILSKDVTAPCPAFANYHPTRTAAMKCSAACASAFSLPDR